MDQEQAKLQADQTYQKYNDILVGSKNNLKEQASNKFQEWRDILTLMEQNVHQTIDDRFQDFQQTFDEESLNLTRLEEDNRVIQFKVGEMLNNYMTQIEANPDYIAYDILDSNPDGLMTDTVESLYQKIEDWLQESKVVLAFDKIKDLEFEYDKVYIWFDHNFEQRLESLTQVVDKNNPLKQTNVGREG